ncbi:hypothetical protein [Pseudolactococcus insecticola]|uniref:Thioredoxin domain-containing protein n=1 Tax=Pseudolactococcus insecticola TaxID=2709158 RepID=A0A6A0B7Y6_9LACT|nr:hypothetical protein [Lactococcus insecticola]GFH41402.1 hypothetical protein Hs20B_18000 [Lactococcus insecticola]
MTKKNKQNQYNKIIATLFVSLAITLLLKVNNYILDNKFYFYINFEHSPLPVINYVMNFFSVTTGIFALGILFLNALETNKFLSKIKIYGLYLVIAFIATFGAPRQTNNLQTFSNNLFPKSSQVFEANKVKDPTNIVFYKLDCPYCQKAIPALLKEMDSENISNSKVMFVDANSKFGKDLAKKMSIESASTAYFFENGIPKKMPLARKTESGKFKANTENIKTFVKSIN